MLIGSLSALEPGEFDVVIGSIGKAFAGDDRRFDYSSSAAVV